MRCRKSEERSTYPVERLLKFNSVNRPKTLLDSLLGKAQPSEHAVSDSEPDERLLFIFFAKLPIWSRLSQRKI